MPTKLQITQNQQFGFWKVIKILPKAESLCLCTACNQTERIIKNYRLKSTKSCGCTKLKYGKKITPGDRFGDWKVLEKDSNRRSSSIAKCLACNNTIRSIRDSDLRQHNTKSCGCKAVENRKNTNQKQYGTNFYTQTKEFQEKSKKTCLEKYGVEYSALSPKIKKKRTTTTLKKYGTEQVFASSKIREKIKQTNLKKYGIETTIDLIHKDQTKLFLSSGQSLTSFCKEHQVNRENAYKIFHNYGEEAFIRYCKSPSKETSIETLLKIILKPLFPNLKKYDKKPKEIEINRRPDFKLIKNNKTLFVNVDGLYAHSELKKQKKYHLELAEHFNKKKLTIFQFRADELRDSKQIVYSMIENYFKLSPYKIAARKCKIKVISTKTANEFFLENHLMGTGSKSTNYGLFFNDKLVACLAFKRKKDSTYEISRFANKLRHNIQGGFSKLLKHAIKNTDAKKIITFCDLRYSSGISYLAAGFKQEKISLGWKWTNGIFTYNRLKCRANMDSRKLTEAEYAKELGWYKIYDAGQVKFILEVQ